MSEGEKDFHKKCARKIFESASVPVLPYTRRNIEELAREIISTSTTVTGVQSKLSLDIARGKDGGPNRFTIVGLWGRFILKPQSDAFTHLPELEDLSMHLAEAAGIKTVPHSLIRFSDGELCYITRRIDRTKNGGKIAMEDMCQLSERLTEDKYKGSYERIAKLLKVYTKDSMVDVVNFWEVVIFSWIIGNADMHLKNFSLYKPEEIYKLAPAYDLLSTALVMPEDTEELALTVVGKKSKINRADFEAAMARSGIEHNVMENIFKRFEKSVPEWEKWITQSFLPEEMKDSLRTLIHEKMSLLSVRK